MANRVTLCREVSEFNGGNRSAGQKSEMKEGRGREQR